MQGPSQDPELEQVYAILGNPYMRAILLTLGERGEASFSELKSALGTSTGNLYYNLDKLSGFVAKNDKRRYVLTEKGQKLYRYVVENESRLRSLLSEKRGLSAFIERRLVPLLVPEGLVAIVYSEQWLSLVVLAFYALLSGAVVLRGSFIVFGMDQLSPPPTLLHRIAFTVAGLLLMLFILEVASRLLGSRRGISLDYLSAAIASTAPLSVSAFLPGEPLLVSIVFRLLQVIVIGVMTAALKVYKGLPAERAFIAVFVTYYVCFTLSLVLQRFI